MNTSEDKDTTSQNKKASAPNRNSLLSIWFSFASLMMLLLIAGCADEQPGVGKPEITDKVDVDLPVDPGEVGLVVDARDVFRQGYFAAEAEITFPDYPDFNQTLTVDPATNLAIIKFPNEDLTDEQKVAFAAGIATKIVVRDANHAVLDTYTSDKEVLDDTNRPLPINSNLAYKKPPLVIKARMPYKLQPEGEAGVMTALCSSCFHIVGFEPENTKQEYKFTPVDGKENVYLIEGFQHPDPDKNQTGTYFDVGQPNINLYKNANWIFLMTIDHAEEFKLEQDDDGWIKIRLEGTDQYLSAESNDLRVYPTAEKRPMRFRLLSDNINWKMSDVGTIFNAPVMPPAKVEFAYEATIRNCSPGTLTEAIGLTKSRTSSHTATFSESLAMFSSHEGSIELKVSAAIGGEIYGAKVTVDVTGKYTYTRSTTSTNENSDAYVSEQSTAVSRTRTLEIPPFKAVEVYDAIRVVSDAHIPYTQRLRISGTYDNAAKTPLTGDEIMTQMLFNLVSGVPSSIGPDYVELSLRGVVAIDEMYETESGADEILGACN